MRSQRIHKSTREEDRIEQDWWNRNADTIEQIWAQTFAFQQTIRKPYLNRAKAFLKNGNDTCTVWEVGCGTGWVCRLIADDHFKVIGTDFSESQIALAKAGAREFGKAHCCEYILTDASTKVEGYNAILISALLHHLTQEELETFFNLFNEVKPGTRVFMYEPVFIEPKNNNGKWLAFVYKQIPKCYRWLTTLLTRSIGRRDKALTQQVAALYEQAEQNGWFLSPKEVPFYESELDGYLNRYFHIGKTYFVNKTDLHISQEMIMNGMNAPGWFYRSIVFPLGMLLDKIFFALNFRSVTRGQYFFKCFELTVK